MHSRAAAIRTTSAFFADAAFAEFGMAEPSGVVGVAKAEIDTTIARSA